MELGQVYRCRALSDRMRGYFKLWSSWRVEAIDYHKREVYLRDDLAEARRVTFDTLFACFDYVPTEYQLIQPKCICGSASVQASVHSDWCDIKS